MIHDGFTCMSRLSRLLLIPLLCLLYICPGNIYFFQHPCKRFVIAFKELFQSNSHLRKTVPPDPLCFFFVRTALISSSLFQPLDTETGRIVHITSATASDNCCFTVTALKPRLDQADTYIICLALLQVLICIYLT